MVEWQKAVQTAMDAVQTLDALQISTLQESFPSFSPSLGVVRLSFDDSNAHSSAG